MRQHNEMIANVVGMLSVGISDIHSMSSTMGWTEPETSKYIRFKYVQIMISSHLCLKFFECVWHVVLRFKSSDRVRSQKGATLRHCQLPRSGNSAVEPRPNECHSAGARRTVRWSMMELFYEFYEFYAIVFSCRLLDYQTWLNSDKTWTLV